MLKLHQMIGRGLVKTRLLVIGLAILAGATFLAMWLLWPTFAPADVSERSTPRLVGELPSISSAPRVPDREPKLSVFNAATPPVAKAPEGYSLVASDARMIKGKIHPGYEKTSDNLPQAQGNHWLRAPDRVDSVVGQANAAGRSWTFGWVQLKPSIRLKDVARSFQQLDMEVLGSAGNLIRVRLPGNDETLRELEEMAGIDGLGVVPPERKLWPSYQRDEQTANPSESLPVFITLMADDPRGDWKRELEFLGAEVGAFDPAIRVYTAEIAYAIVADLAALDFVMAVEPIGIVTATHDTAIQVMGADALRTYSGTPGVFTGTNGSSVPIAVMDTGLNTSHPDISSNRESICGANFAAGRDSRVENQDLWVDERRHGTHVTGTVAGNGSVHPYYAGMAPGVSHIRFAKVLNVYGSGYSSDILRGMDFLSLQTSCPDAGWSDASVKPLVVNMSLSASSDVFQGRDTSARKLDSIVWTHRQLYVVANSNSGNRAFSDYGAAKNSLAVGAIIDGGALVPFSSRGPTADNRLAPNIVATGVDVYSTAGDGSTSEYTSFSGTSMASPSVAGVATLLLDAAPEHREQPALARARLMASAIRPDHWLTGDSQFALDNSNGPGARQGEYGLGKVSARTSVLNRDESDGWVNGGAVAQLDDQEYAYYDIEVPENTSRLDLVMTWDEPPTDTITSAVLNDIDLWLDHGADCESQACGEYSSVSRIDNVEWIVIPNPPAGTYRAKLLAHRVYTASPDVALAWTLIRGETTPQLNLEVEQQEIVLNNGESTELTLTLTAGSYVAAGTRLQIDCRGTEDHNCQSGSVQMLREDDVELTDTYVGIGDSITLGELAVGESQQLNVTLWGRGNAARYYFSASSWNGAGTSASVQVRNTGTEEEVPEVGKPPNSDFANATLLEGSEGTSEFDLIRATAEAGEPAFITGAFVPRMRIASLWYKWTVPARGHYQFGVSYAGTTQDSWQDLVYVDAFQGESIAGLELVAAKEWGMSIFAEEGQTYFIRVSNNGRAFPMTLNWSEGLRPANDEYEAAALLEGESGEYSGNNQGATLERGESLGRLAATVWHQWTAPRDGIWRFKSSVSRLKVGVFAGDMVDSLRLLSGVPGAQVSVYAKEGEVYRIAVATADAFESGGKYTLSWSEVEEYHGARSNDLFENALIIGEEASSGGEFTLSLFEVKRRDDGLDSLLFGNPGVIDEEASSSLTIELTGSETVEPEEPPETGVHTRWYVWTAPEDGMYTWRLQEASGSHIDNVMSVFSGEDIEGLQLVATNFDAQVHTREISFQVVAGQRYWISLGYSASTLRAFDYGLSMLTLSWGRTPANDSVMAALALEGTSGMVSGSNHFATTESGERTGHHGHSSLWWKFEVEEDGYYRFWIESDSMSLTLTIYSIGIDGELAPGALSFLNAGSSTDASGDGTEVVFSAKTGLRYLVRIGTSGAADGGEFTLNWEQSPFNGLRYIGRVAGSFEDANGDTVELGPFDSSSLSLAFHADGTALYAGSPSGVHVFERDGETGLLSQVQLIDGFLDTAVDSANFGSGVLQWDPHRSKLYALECNYQKVHTFKPVDSDSRQLAEDRSPNSMLNINFNSLCASIQQSNDISGITLMSPYGSFLYYSPRWSQALLYVTTFDSSGNLIHVESHGAKYQIKDVAATKSGHFMYFLTNSELTVRQRSVTAGTLTQVVDSTQFLDSGPSGAISLTGDDRHLFYVSSSGDQASVYAVDGDALTFQQQEDLSVQFPRSAGFSSWPCFAHTRNASTSLDVFCRSSAYTLEWKQDTGELKVSDYLEPGQTDSAGTRVPQFTLKSSLMSPDGKHAYLATLEGIYIFERVGNPVVEPPSAVRGGYARFDQLSVSSGTVQLGSLSSSACLTVSSTGLDDSTYSVVTSAWQSMPRDGVEWSELSDTSTTGELCAFSPPDDDLYRLVAQMTIDGTTGKYASNIISNSDGSEPTGEYVRLDGLEVSTGSIRIGALTVSGCTTLDNTSLNGVTYTVHESFWEVKDAADEWNELADTREESSMCSYRPSDDREYRLVLDATIDGNRAHYVSNAMTR